MVGLCKAVLKMISYKKNPIGHPGQTGNPSQFLDPPTKVLLQYANLDFKIPDGKQLLMTYFFQNFPDIRVKHKHLEKGTLTPKPKDVAMAFMEETE